MSKTEFILQDLTGISSFSKNIYINFPVRKLDCTINYAHDNTEDGVSAVRCQQLSTSSNGIINVFQDVSSVSATIPFQFETPRMFNGAFTFEILTDTLALDATRNGKLVIILSFYP